MTGYVGYVTGNEGNVPGHNSRSILDFGNVTGHMTGYVGYFIEKIGNMTGQIFYWTLLSVTYPVMFHVFIFLSGMSPVT